MAGASLLFAPAFEDDKIEQRYRAARREAALERDAAWSSVLLFVLLVGVAPAALRRSGPTGPTLAALAASAAAYAAPLLLSRTSRHRDALLAAMQLAALAIVGGSVRAGFPPVAASAGRAHAAVWLSRLLSTCPAPLALGLNRFGVLPFPTFAALQLLSAAVATASAHGHCTAAHGAAAGAAAAAAPARLYAAIDGAMAALSSWAGGLLPGQAPGGVDAPRACWALSAFWLTALALLAPCVAALLADVSQRAAAARRGDRAARVAFMGQSWPPGVLRAAVALAGALQLPLLPALWVALR
jgi:hypothetical protein